MLSSPHLLGIDGMPLADAELILETAAYFKEVINRPIKKVPSLRDVTVANLFFENSTRTRLSFEIAQKRLSADTLTFATATSSLNKGETLLDTVRNIMAMKVDMLVMRHSSIGAAHFISRNVDAHVINAGDGTREHPTQALLDALTLKTHFGSLKGLKVAIVGDIKHSRVARSNLFLLPMLGAKVRFYGPGNLIPAGLVELGADAPPSGDVREALAWADAVMALRVQLERAGSTPLFPPAFYASHYGINRQMLDEVNRPELVIMHPGPINRGVELMPDVADGPESLILDQVENGVAVRMAVMYLLAGKAMG